MQAKKRLGIIFTFPISESRGDFLTHIPIRFRRTLGKGVEVFVLYSGALNGDIVRPQGVHPVEMVRIGNRRIIRMVFPILLFIYTLWFIRKYRLDVVMNANNHRWMLPIGLAARMYGKRSVARVTGDILGAKGNSARKRIWFYYKKYVERSSLMTVDKILCLSHALKDMTIERVGQEHKIHVISQGVDTNRFTLPPKVGISGELPERLVFIGRIELNKGLHHTLDAFRRLRQEGYKIRFDIYGDGSQKSFLEKEYGDIGGVQFHGQINHDKVPYVLGKGGILVLPSMSEGLPNVILESMASGVSVIVSNVGDNALLVGNGERGILLHSTDSDQIRKSVIYLLKNREYVTETVLRAYDYVRTNHSFCSVKDKYLKLLFYSG